MIYVATLESIISSHLAHEDRLSKQYRDMESERDLLRSLTNKLEAHLTQQTQAMEEERWAIQQERARLKAGEKALEEEKRSFLSRLDQERRDLVQTKVNKSKCSVTELL